MLPRGSKRFKNYAYKLTDNNIVFNLSQNRSKTLKKYTCQLCKRPNYLPVQSRDLLISHCSEDF